MQAATFEAKWNRLRPRLYQRAKLITGNPEISEDLTMEVALRLCRNLSKLPEDGAGGFSLQAAAFFRLQCLIRQRWNRAQGKPQLVPLLLEDRSGETFEHPDLTAAAEARRRAEWEESERLHEARRRILHASKNSKQAFILKCRLEGYSMEEIGNHFGFSRQNVSLIVNDGLARLRSLPPDLPDSGADWEGERLFNLGADVSVYQAPTLKG